MGLDSPGKYVQRRKRTNEWTNEWTNERM